MLTRNEAAEAKVETRAIKANETAKEEMENNCEDERCGYIIIRDSKLNGMKAIKTTMKSPPIVAVQQFA